jgi:hypothetical protein
MAVKLTRLTHKIAIQLRLVAESCIIRSFRSRQPVRKLLDTPSSHCFRQGLKWGLMSSWFLSSIELSLCPLWLCWIYGGFLWNYVLTLIRGGRDLDMPTFAHPIKKIPTFFRTPKFITLFIRTSRIYSTSTCLTSLRCILLFGSHLLLCLPTVSFRCFPTKLL